MDVSDAINAHLVARPGCGSQLDRIILRYPSVIWALGLCLDSLSRIDPSRSAMDKVTYQLATVTFPFESGRSEGGDDDQADYLNLGRPLEEGSVGGLVEGSGDCKSDNCAGIG